MPRAGLSVAAASMASGRAAIGQVTRGTTNTNRLRRVDRWIARQPALLARADPFVVDLGYGASGVTTLELPPRLGRDRADVEVLGLEIDPARVTPRERSSRGARGRHPLPRGSRGFALGGFEVPPRRRRPAVIRAFNVLRQYDEADVAGAWGA